MEMLQSTYNWPLVFLSIVIVLSSSYIALHISSQLSLRFGIARKQWIFTGTVIQTLGFWSMHFMGMLAFHLTIDVTYNISLVLLSIVPAFLACGILFYLISRSKLTKMRIVLGAFFVGTGIILMHYIGMAAMEMDAEIRYDPSLWSISVFVAFAASLASLFLLIYVREFQGFHWKKLMSALIMAVAVTGMHYIGMAAAVFEHAHQPSLMQAPGSATHDPTLTYNIGIGLLIMVLVAFISIRTSTLLRVVTEVSDKKFESVIESMKDGIIVIDQDGIILQWNGGATQLFGYAKEEVIRKNITLLIPERMRGQHEKGLHRYMSEKDPHPIAQTVELAGLKKDGSEFPIEISMSAWSTEEGMFFSSIIRDITERKLSEAKIKELIFIDPLTGLANRRLFYEQLPSALNQAKETGHPFALLYLDLDQFKLINDTFGHLIGDQLLQEVAARLQKCVNTKDTVARLSGDEFILLLENTKRDEAEESAQTILEVLNRPFLLSEKQVVITPSIGISLFPSDGNNEEDLVKNADMAMYHAKEKGKNNYRFFKEEMNEANSIKTKLAFAIRKGLEQKEFTVHYQPQIDLKTGRIIGVEALVRWTHPEWGVIPPADFIPIAEETESIIQLGRYILRQACIQNKAWQDAGIPPFRVAVNVSAHQFSKGDLASEVQSALKISNLPAKYLELELTESIIQESDTATGVMHKLKEMGVSLSIDDFGTGYSSLTYLKIFPIDTLKIDQQFTRGIESDPKDKALVATIIQMAHNLNLNVIAEGVETVAQVDFLKQKGCNQAQGYYFHHPMSAEGIQNLYTVPISELAH